MLTQTSDDVSQSLRILNENRQKQIADNSSAKHTAFSFPHGRGSMVAIGAGVKKIKVVQKLPVSCGVA